MKTAEPQRFSGYNEDAVAGATNTLRRLTHSLEQSKEGLGMEPTRKTCPRCGESKLVDAFGKNRAASDGLQTWCQTCRRSYHSQNRDTINERAKQRKDRDRAEERRKSKEWRDANRDSIREYERTYRLDNAEPIKARAWKNQYEHRALAAGFTPVADLLTRRDVVAVYGDACFYCGGEFMELDHYTPVTKGGTHVLDNVRPSCRTCNSRKYNTDGEDWMRDA